MAIQMRRGQLVNFDPAKMLPGEWGVSTDSDTGDQHVYMCFRAGVVKRMATHEDFEADMEAISDLIVNGNAAATAAQIAADKANAVVANKIGINDSAASYTTTYSSNYINDSLDNLFPGGTNILRNTNVGTDYATSGLWSNGIWFKFGTSYATVDKVAVTDAPNPDIAYGMKINKTGTGADSGIRQSSIPLPIGYEYTLSCYVRSSDKANIKFQIGETNYAWVNTAFTTTTTTEWQRFSVTFKALYPTTSFVFGIATTLTGNAEFCGMKLEAGNKATDWSPSPWDVTNRLTKLEAAITTLGGTI